MARHGLEEPYSLIESLRMMQDRGPVWFELNSDMDFVLTPAQIGIDIFEHALNAKGHGLSFAMTYSVLDGQAKWKHKVDLCNRHSVLMATDDSMLRDCLLIQDDCSKLYSSAQLQTKVFHYRNVCSAEKTFNALEQATRDSFIAAPYLVEITSEVMKRTHPSARFTSDIAATRLFDLKIVDGRLNCVSVTRTILEDIGPIINDPDKPFQKFRRELLKNWSPTHG